MYGLKDRRHVTNFNYKYVYLIIDLTNLLH